MNLPAFAMRKRAIVVAAVVITSLWGLFSFATAPRREDPEFTIRVCVVSTEWPGATAEKVEQLVTDPIEKALETLDEVDKVTSQTKAGHSAVFVTLDDSIQNVDNVWDKVRAKMDRVRQDLPAGGDQPHVDTDFGDTAAMVLALYQVPQAAGAKPTYRYTLREMEIFADQVKDELKKLPAVARVDLVGVQQEVIYLESDPGRWSQLDLTIRDLQDRLEQRNIVAPGGTIDTDYARFGVRPAGEFNAVRQIERLIVGTHKNRSPVYLRDLGITVSRRYEEPPSLLSRFNRPDLSEGLGCVVISFTMKDGGNISILGEDVKAKLAELEKTLLPPDVRTAIVADQPDLVDVAIRDFISNLWQAIVIVILVAFLLIGLRIAVVMAAAIPLVILTSFGITRAFGVQLEQVSIASLIIALGMLVDNAIEVGDNVHRLLEEGRPRFDAAVAGSKEIAFPVLIATLTTVAAFLPMLTLPGSEGEYMFSLPVVVSTTLMVSWFLAMTITTIMAYWFLRAPKAHGKSGSPLVLLVRLGAWVARKVLRRPAPVSREKTDRMAFFVRLSGACLAHKGLTILVAAAAFVGACALPATGLIGTQYFPPAYRSQFVIDVHLPEGTPIRRTDLLCRQVEQILRETSPGTLDGRPVQRMANAVSYVGEGGPRFYLSLNPEQPGSNYAQIVINTIDPAVTEGYVQDVRARADAEVRGARVVVRKLDMGPGVDSPIAVRVLGPDIPTLRAAAEEIKDVLRRAEGTLDVHDSWGLDGYQLLLEPDEDKGRLAGVTPAAIARTANAFFSGHYLTTFREGDHQVPVYFRLPSDQRGRIEAVPSIYPEGEHGKVPLDAVAGYRAQWVPARIERRRRDRNLEVRARVREGVLANTVVESVLPEIQAIGDRLGGGHRIEVGGEQEETSKSQENMSKAFGISLLLIVFCLIVQYNSAVKPMVILLTLPMAATGAFLGLFVTGNPLGFMAQLGLLSLAGVVLNDAIVLIEFVTKLIREQVAAGRLAPAEGERSYSGLTREGFRECVTRGARMRILPILLTTLTTVGGLIPLALAGGPLWQPMAVVIIFGLLTATLLTLLVLPAILALFVEQFRVTLVAPAAEEARV